MPRRAINRAPEASQKGAALVVCLVLLLVLTIVGTASVEDINLQSNMARNSQFLMQAFNTALSESDAQISMDLLNRTVSAPGGQISLDDAELVMASDAVQAPFEQTVTIRYDEANSGGPASGYGLNFQQFRFEINSTAALPNTGTRSDQVQGLSFVGAKPN